MRRRACGGFVERKGATLTVHWREAPDTSQAATELSLRAISVAHDTGLITRPARMAIELRPPLPFDKGSAVRALLRARPCARSLYAGDDVTDIDAFAASTSRSRSSRRRRRPGSSRRRRSP